MVELKIIFGRFLTRSNSEPPSRGRADLCCCTAKHRMRLAQLHISSKVISIDDFFMKAIHPFLIRLPWELDKSITICQRGVL